MSALDNAFAFFAPTPTPVGYMDATLTGTEQVSKLPAGIFTASGASVTYVPGPTPTITFDVTLYCKTPAPVGPPPTYPVTLTQNHPLPGSVYSMAIPFPSPFNCTAKVDAASGVVYGSKGHQFVTLVLKVVQG